MVRDAFCRWMRPSHHAGLWFVHSPLRSESNRLPD